MIKLHGCLALMWCAMVMAAGAAEAVVVRSSIRPDGQRWVGQRLVLAIDVLGKDQWASVPRVPVVEVAGCTVMRSDSQGVRLSEPIEGVSYSGQRYEFSVFPHRAGELVVAPFELTVKMGSEVEKLMTPECRFSVELPDGVQDASRLITAPNCSLTGSWSPQGAEFKVGDAVTRTVVMSADNVSGMAFAPVRFVAPEGVAAYPNEPDVRDRSDRGSLKGQRIESAVYVFQRAGEYELPAVTFEWWNPETSELTTLELPSLNVTVSGSAAAGDGSASGGVTNEGDGLPFSWWWSVVVVCIVGGGIWWQRSGHRQWIENRERHKVSEPYLFKQLQAELKSGAAPDVVWHALDVWLQTSRASDGSGRSFDSLRATGDDASITILDQLSAACYGDGGEWNAHRQLGDQLEQVRALWLNELRTNTKHAPLPPLNP